MDTVVTCINRFDEAVELLPYHLRGPARLLDELDKATAEEIRLRAGYPPVVVLPTGERPFSTICITRKELTAVLEVTSAASAHAVRDSLRNGYITARGGFRVGFGGQVSVRDGEVSGFLHLSSASIRITREFPGLAGDLMESLTDGDRLLSTLVLSPPGGGKTTVLRDIIRQVSDGGLRVALADERGEVAAQRDGVNHMDVGRCTDVLGGCPKDKAVMMLLRAMNPHVVAMDEITANGDTQALESAANCGVSLLATAHGSSLEDLMKKPMYRRMVRKGLFDRLLLITKHADGTRDYHVSVLEAG